MVMLRWRIIAAAICAVLILAEIARAETNQVDPAGAERVRISAGVSLDYAWWDPVWGRINQTGDMFVYFLLNSNIPFLKIEEKSRAYAVKPSLLYGIHAEAEFAKGWGLSAAAAAGTYPDSSVMVTSLTTNTFAPFEYLKYRVDTVNFEGTLLAWYRFADWIKLSFGPVYQGYTLKESNTSFLSSQSYKETIHMAGFSAGGSFDVRLAENFYLKPAASFLYLYGFVSGSSGLSHRSNSNVLGVSSAVSLAYYIEKIRVMLSLGFRYQALYYFQVTNSDYLNCWDHRYGVSESITYTF